MPQIQVQIDRNGSLRIEGQDFVGAACEAAIAPYVAALGADPSNMEIEKKPEYYQGISIEESNQG